MPYWTYILRSESSGRYYCGSTGDLENRVRQHNDPGFKASQTTGKFQGPWELIWSTMTLEKKIKKRGIARYLEG
jgi:predicted GIY-YIG superfamily endonuclease